MVWYCLKRRCENPSDAGFKNYGGRGISVCKMWSDSFENFFNDMGQRPESTSIDRIDNDGPYSPENCRWATKLEQDNNRRTNRNITISGETMTATKWARKIGINVATFYSRMRTGWSAERIKSTKINPHKLRLITLRGATMSVQAWEKSLGFGREVIRERLRRGWSEEDALTTPSKKSGFRHYRQ